VGSGFCGYAFAERILRKSPKAKVLMLERGPFFLPEHFQNLPQSFSRTIGGLSETFPWTVDAETINSNQDLKWTHGCVPFFGGRSTLWSGWCPQPHDNELEGWPASVIEILKNTYWKEGSKLLNVISAGGEKRQEISKDELLGHTPIYSKLQHKVHHHLEQNLKEVGDIRFEPAPLAVRAHHDTVSFNKFSTPGPLLELISEFGGSSNAERRLKVVTNCVVEKIIQHDGKTATALQTSRGVLSIGSAKLVLAMGSLPPCTLLANSFPKLRNNIGPRFTAHFISSIVAKVPVKNFVKEDENLGPLEIGAFYVTGQTKYKKQWHIQMTALHDTDPEKHKQAALRNMPDVVATASLEQLATAKDSVVFVCAVLGELDWDNKHNKFIQNEQDHDLTTNSTLFVKQNEKDNNTWDEMDEATFKILENVLSPAGQPNVEYWHSDAPGSNKWNSKRPHIRLIRVPGMVHEGSTLFIGEEDSAPVNLDYRFRGVENVYITGGGLWPTSGSWNPTLTMVGLAQHLADKFIESRTEKS